MIDSEALKRIAAAVEDEKGISADDAAALYESYVVAAKLVNKHHRSINRCFFCDYDPIVQPGQSPEFDWEEASRTYEYGFTGSNDPNDPNSYVHSTSDDRESVERLWGPDMRNELQYGKIVKREKAGPWRNA